MTPPRESVTIKSYAGYAKPISQAQVEALRVVEGGDVFYKPSWGRVFGVRNDTYEVLERNGLVEVLDEPENPEALPRSQRHAVRLTERGREVVEALR